MANLLKKLLNYISKTILIDCIDSINLLYKIISFKAGLKLRKLSLGCKSLEDFYDLINTFTYSIYQKSKFTVAIKLYQKKDEIIEFIKIYSKIDPKIIFEIGTYDGGTLFFLSKFANSNATLITLDLPIIRDGVGYSPAKIPFYKSFKSKSQKIYFIRDDSHRISALKKVKKILKNKKIDALFIDGDHTYEGVKKDFEIFSPLVRDGGIIAFHDIFEHPIEMNCQVSVFWNEIKEQFESKEIISKDLEQWAGIGIIQK